ncbi:hypothetical protein ABT095_14620 [Kitasatospora sp. NPDC002227]|uniref:hypothetical protein n=1 Tax=Kitasatospora sp. NPDC002227 TaxID=3154773 RepID=UPI0033245E4E
MDGFSPAPQVPCFFRGGLIGSLRAVKGGIALLALGASGATGLLDAFHLHVLASRVDRLQFWLAVRAGRWAYRASCLDGTVTVMVPGPDSVYLPELVDGADPAPLSPLDQARADHLAGLCCPADVPIEGCRPVQDAVLAADPTLLDLLEADLMRRFAALDGLPVREDGGPR